jgi:hypothetical protein
VNVREKQGEGLVAMHSSASESTRRVTLDDDVVWSDRAFKPCQISFCLRSNSSI